MPTSFLIASYALRLMPFSRRRLYCSAHCSKHCTNRNNMPIPALSSFVLAALLCVGSMALSSCAKDCYDQHLFDQCQLIDCTSDCQYVTGCDGNTYCNECVANCNGIAVE